MAKSEVATLLLLRIDEAADALRISRTTLYGLLRSDPQPDPATARHGRAHGGAL